MELWVPVTTTTVSDQHQRLHHLHCKSRFFKAPSVIEGSNYPSNKCNSQKALQIPVTVESRNGDDISGTNAEVEQPLRQAQDAVDELMASVSPVAGDGDCGVYPESCEAAQAVANVGPGVKSHGCGVDLS